MWPWEICKWWLSSALRQHCSAVALAGTLGMAWLQASAPPANSRWRKPTPQLRTPLLRLQTQQLRLNGNAPMPRRQRAVVLQLRQR